MDALTLMRQAQKRAEEAAINNDPSPFGEDRTAEILAHRAEAWCWAIVSIAESLARINQKT